MRLLYIDIDTLRADHLGVYGYARATSPNIDAVARQGVRFTGCYASDVPCLPSRTALCTGRFGTRSGVVGHGGSAADLAPEGPSRGFSTRHGRESFAACLRKAGLYTATISSFAERHGALHWLAGFRESLSPGKRGLETADEVHALASDWLARHAEEPNWFLHVHLWDPHTPYRAAPALGEPFAQDPLPAWLTEQVRAQHFAGVGPHSAQEAVGFSTEYPYGDYPRQPLQIASMRDVRRLIDGYDLGVRVADDCVGRLVEQLGQLGVLDDTAIVITSDHGETLGELNVYGDHHTTDEHVARVPMVVRAPGLSARVEPALCYQIDVAATLIELCGGQVPVGWDGRSFASELRAGAVAGRDHLVLTTGAWTCQRAVRWDRYVCIHTKHDGYHDYPDTLLFDLERDPHEQHDLSASHPELVDHSTELLGRFTHEVLRGGIDPLDTVIAEGGPAHVRGQLPRYLERLRATGRTDGAVRLSHKHAT